jgi:hypothetical protein
MPQHRTTVDGTGRLADLDLGRTHVGREHPKYDSLYTAVFFLPTIPRLITPDQAFYSAGFLFQEFFFWHKELLSLSRSVLRFVGV